MPPVIPTTQEYNYTNSGMDNFLNRSIDQVSWQTTLDAQLNMPGSESLTTLPSVPNSNQLNYNMMAVNGQLGDTLQIGGQGGSAGITLTNGAIVASDGSNDYLLIGDDGNGSTGH